MASSALLMFALQGLLLMPQVVGLSAYTEEAHRLRQHQRHAAAATMAMDASGRMEVKPHGHRGSHRVLGGEKTKLQQQYPFYHTSDEIRSEALRLSKKCGGHLNFTTLKEDKVEIDVITVRKASAKPANKVFILFGEHSRELISPESGLYMLRALCSDVALNVSSLPGLLKESSTPEEVLEDAEFQIVLNANPRSRKKVEDGSYCLRVDPNGVDLNRNWDERWQQQAATFGGDSNPGPTPFSEPETRIFKRLVTEFMPTTFLTVHSGTKGMYMPWAYDMDHDAKFNAKPMMDVLTALDKQHCQCPFGAAGHEVGYPCPGTCLDYAYAKLNTPFVFAFEIYTRHESDDGLRQRWSDKMRSGGAQLIENGHGLGHPHFHDFFHKYGSDFVGSNSLFARGSAMDVSAQAAQTTDDECFYQFNPDTKDDYEKTVKNWAETYLQMSTSVAQMIRNGQVAKGTVTEPSAKAATPPMPVQ